MIVSRTLARRRIAVGVRPGWAAAWGPVMLDTAILMGLMAVAFRAMGGLFTTWPVWAAIMTLFLTFFIPLQIVLITSALWAARSRWTEKRSETSTD